MYNVRVMVYQEKKKIKRQEISEVLIIENFPKLVHVQEAEQITNWMNPSKCMGRQYN